MMTLATVFYLTDRTSAMLWRAFATQRLDVTKHSTSIVAYSHRMVFVCIAKNYT